MYNTKAKIDCGFRVHINSLDMGGRNWRCCGGIGFAVEFPKLEITVEYSIRNQVIAAVHSDYAMCILEKVKCYYKISSCFLVSIKESVSPHNGFGTETQIALALTTIILKMENIKTDYEEIATKLGLAGVSGIGYASFVYGGFIADGGYIWGKDKKTFVEHAKRPPIILQHMDFPKNWKVLLVVPQNTISISGEEENAFFAEYTPVPEKEVKDITYYTFMGIIPAILETDYKAFISSLKVVSALGTKKAERKINSQNCDWIIEKMERKFGFGGLSSLGPLCYTFIEDSDRLSDVDYFKEMFPTCNVYLTTVRNTPYNLQYD